MNKPKIIFFIDWFLPAFKAGGPITSVLALSKILTNHFNVVIITGDRDLNDKAPFAHILFNQKVKEEISGAEVYYLKRGFHRIRTVIRIVQSEKPDVVYINGIFSFWFSLFPLLLMKMRILSCKVIICPRGMIGDNTLQIKRYKKQLFLSITRLIGWYHKIVWHATSETEKSRIKQHVSGEPEIVVIPNIPISFNYVNENNHSKKAGELSLVYCSRILPIKNLLFLLQLLSEIKDGNITLDIYGPIEEEDYWGKCRNIIRVLPANVKVNYLGAVNAHTYPVNYSRYDFMVLPTLHENFGHSISEALSAGCPVIISDNTPWRGLSAANAGFDIPLSLRKNWISSVTHCLHMTHDEHQKWKEGAKLFFDNKSDLKNNKEKYLQLLTP
ncbi:MAG: glycosyltransferase family 4 protein [Bacteroidia bacterium]|nr:glycosyltransferase family 4 protein [Bacteroidia bacterium]